MEEPKPSASLSGVLLARKGGARPAMRRPAIAENDGEAAAAQDDLGWNDMGYDVNPAPDAPMDSGHDSRINPLAAAVPEVKPEVRQQQELIARQLQAQPETDYPKEDIGEATKSPSLSVGGVWAAEVDETDEAEISKKPVLMEKPVKTETASVKAETPVVAVEPSTAVAAAPKKRAAPGSKSKAAFTLRLDKERHLKLRLACAVNNKSAQNLVTEALDALLDNMPEVDQLAANVPNIK